MTLLDSIKNSIGQAARLKEEIASDERLLASVCETVGIIAECFKNGKKLLIAGNGGSAADAQHFATELTGTLAKEKRRGLPAIPLTTNTSFLTAWANDFDFASIFSRQLEALGGPDDIFVGISTSGNSENIIQAVLKAKELGIKTICLLGNDGGKLKDLADISIIVPSAVTARTQEVHILVIHIVCERLLQDYQWD